MGFVRVDITQKRGKIMQKILIEISHQDQVFVEEECTKLGHSLSSFFLLLLNQYREPTVKENNKHKEVHAKEIKELTDEANAIEEEFEINKKQSGIKQSRKKKSQ